MQEHLSSVCLQLFFRLDFGQPNIHHYDDLHDGDVDEVLEEEVKKILAGPSRTQARFQRASRCLLIR